MVRKRKAGKFKYFPAFFGSSCLKVAFRLFADALLELFLQVNNNLGHAVDLRLPVERLAVPCRIGSAYNGLFLVHAEMEQD